MQISLVNPPPSLPLLTMMDVYQGFIFQHDATHQNIWNYGCLKLNFACGGGGWGSMYM